MATVRVSCAIPNGIQLCLFQHTFDDGTGEGMPRHAVVTRTVTVPGPRGNGAGLQGSTDYPIVSEIDAEFFDAWQKANPESPILTSGALRLTE